MTATPAFAVDNDATMSPDGAPIGGGATVTVTGTVGANDALDYANLAGRLIATAATCAATYGTGTTGAVAMTRTDPDTATFTSPALAAGTYKLCFYGSASAIASGTALVGHSTDDLTIGVASTNPTLSAPAGPVAGGNEITATGTGAWITTSTVSTVFTTAGSCPATYTTAGNFTGTTVRTSTSVATITVPSTLVAGTAYKVCFYGGTSSSSALLGTAAGTYAPLPAATLSPAQGPEGGTNDVTIFSTEPILATAQTPGVTFAKGNCPGTYATSTSIVAGTNILRINQYKLAVRVPNLQLGVDEATAEFSACVYAGTGGSDKLLGVPAKYTIAEPLVVSGVDALTVEGPAQGGAAVTIEGSGFPTVAGALLEANIGGSKVTIKDVKSDGTEIYGTTSAHAPGAAAVTVTTAAGTVTTPNTPYSYTYGITISPNTAPGDADEVYVDILGAGFTGLPFNHADGPGNKEGAHVFLLNGDAYDADWDPALSALNECTNVIKISDVEIICKLDLTREFTDDATLAATGSGTTANGTYTMAVVNLSATDAVPTPGTEISIISSGSTFTVAPY